MFYIATIQLARLLEKGIPPGGFCDNLRNTKILSGNLKVHFSKKGPYGLPPWFYPYIITLEEANLAPKPREFLICPHSS